MFPKRGDIWLVSLEHTIGHEIGKTRPALVISNNINNQYADTVTVLPLTSNVDRIYPFETLLAKEDTNLPKDSKVKANQIRTVDKKRLIKYLAAIPDEKLKDVESATLIHLGII